MLANRKKLGQRPVRILNGTIVLPRLPRKPEACADQLLVHPFRASQREF
jgi:hypothetical protein